MHWDDSTVIYDSQGGTGRTNGHFPRIVSVEKPPIKRYEKLAKTLKSALEKKTDKKFREQSL